MPNRYSPPVNRLSRITPTELAVFDAIDGLPGTFTAADVARLAGCSWLAAFRAIETLMDAGKVWRSAESWSRYTTVAALQRQRTEVKIGKAACYAGLQNCRVNRRAGA
jgi:hypothetical protein